MMPEKYSAQSLLVFASQLNDEYESWKNVKKMQGTIFVLDTLSVI